VYLKDTRNGAILRFEEGKNASEGYRPGGGGSIEVNVDGTWYEVHS
jgi:hypothetical protein